METYSHEEIDKLVEDDDWISKDYDLDKLINDPDDLVRYLASKHPNISIEQLERLTEDSNINISNFVKEKLKNFKDEK